MKFVICMFYGDEYIILDQDIYKDYLYLCAVSVKIPTFLCSNVLRIQPFYIHTTNEHKCPSCTKGKNDPHELNMESGTKWPFFDART